jgi:DNA-binding beta-propeller fold protein YncE
LGRALTLADRPESGVELELGMNRFVPEASAREKMSHSGAVVGLRISFARIHEPYYWGMEMTGTHSNEGRASLLTLVVVLTFAPTGVAQSSGLTLKKVGEFDLRGPAGKRFDYLTVDLDDHYLLSAHLAAKQTYVIDLKTNKFVATVTDTPGAEGVEYVPEFKKFYTSNAYDNTVGVVDLKEMKVVKKLETEAKPDGSTYAGPFHKLYVSDERGKAEAVIDVTKDKILKTLHFDSETGMSQYDPVARKVYVNLQDQNIFAVIDPATDEVVGHYPVRRCKGNHGMALDPEHHRAFLSCEGNELLTVFDLDKHASIGFCHWQADRTSSNFDPGLGRIYVACYSGAISVFHEDDADHYRKLEDFRVQLAVHTMVVDLQTHRLYTPEQEEDGKPVARMVEYDAAGDR